MAVTRQFKLPSTNGRDKLHVYLWEPAAPKAILQLSHGMCEHLGRYDDFACQLADQGILVIGNDHLGHGMTASSPEELGYFHSSAPSATVVDDLHQITLWAKEHFPGLPLFLLGHSMGSFMARRYCMTYGEELAGAVIMGTGSQPAPILSAGLNTAKIIGKARGSRYRSPLLYNLSLGGYNSQIKNPRTAADWLSVNPKNVDKYLLDPFCTFRFTVNGYLTLFTTIQFIQSPANIARIPNDLPIFVVSGAEDPVGGNGKGVLQAAAALKKQCPDTVCKLYPGMRHEILNEDDRAQVITDILNWIQKYI